MIDVTLAAVANQDLTIQLDDSIYEIRVHEATNCMSISVTRDGMTLVEGMRLTTGTPVLPYRYQEEGNFILSTDEDALPDWQQFGVTQFLTYVSAEELAAFRAE